MCNRQFVRMCLLAVALISMLALGWHGASAQPQIKPVPGAILGPCAPIALPPGPAGGAGPVVPLTAGPLGPAQPLTPEQEKTPWSKPVGGLAIRIILDKEYHQGQAVNALVQLKNASDKPLLIHSYVNPTAGGLTKLVVTKPDGKAVELPSRTFPIRLFPQSCKELGAGDALQFSMTDFPSSFPAGTFEATGSYSVAYTFIGKKPEDLAAAGGGPPAGPNMPKFTDEQLQKLFVGEATGSATLALKALGKDDLVVHEWGVFTVQPNAEYANADMKAEWATMPEFFYRQFPTPRMRIGYGMMNVKKPIVYFYSPLEGLKVRLEVSFGKGAPVVWWPAADEPRMSFGPSSGAARLPAGGPVDMDVIHHLVFAGWLGGKAAGGGGAGNNGAAPKPGGAVPGAGPAGGDPTAGGAGGAGPAEVEVPADSWVRDARLKDAARFNTLGLRMMNGRPMGDQPECERFIYYDGLVASPNHLKVVKADAKTISLANEGVCTVKNLYVVDRQAVPQGGRLRIARLAKPLDAGATVDLPLVEVAAEQWTANSLPSEIKKALTDAGLLAPEAEALLKIWNKGFFQADGLTVFYVLPQSEYDKLLPAKIEPSPAGGMVRVGVVLLAHAEGTAAINAQVQELIKKLDSDNFDEREAATKALGALGPAAIPALRDALQNNPSPEVQQRCKSVLDNLDATQWLNKPAKANAGGDQPDAAIPTPPPGIHPPIPRGSGLDG